jgi:hypothetical protein
MPTLADDCELTSVATGVSGTSDASGTHSISLLSLDIWGRGPEKTREGESVFSSRFIFACLLEVQTSLIGQKLFHFVKPGSVQVVQRSPAAAVI